MQFVLMVLIINRKMKSHLLTLFDVKKKANERFFCSIVQVNRHLLAYFDSLLEGRRRRKSCTYALRYRQKSAFGSQMMEK